MDRAMSAQATAQCGGPSADLSVCQQGYGSLAYVLALPPISAAGIVLFAAMPTGANAYIFSAQYGRLTEAVSGTVALGTVLAAVTLPVIVAFLTVAQR